MENPIKIDSRSLISLILWMIFVVLGLSILGFYYAFSLFYIPPNTYNWGYLIPIGLLILLDLWIIFAKLGPVTKVMGKWENYEYKLKEESIIREIIEQDYKLLQMKIMQDEHNVKIRDYNKQNTDGFQEIDWRKADSIAKQALDQNFYEKLNGNNKDKKKK